MSVTSTISEGDEACTQKSVEGLVDLRKNRSLFRPQVGSGIALFLSVYPATFEVTPEFVFI